VFDVNAPTELLSSVECKVVRVSAFHKKLRQSFRRVQESGIEEIEWREISHG